MTTAAKTNEVQAVESSAGNDLALLREKRLTLELELENRKLAAVERTQRAIIAMESYTAGEFVNRNEWRAPELGAGFSSISLLSDRADGANRPFTESLTDVAMARGLARMVSTADCPGVGVQTNLTNYVVGAGYTFDVSTKKKREAPAGLVAAIQEIVDEFLDRHDWVNDFDREWFWRGHRDGERFLALYPQRDGKMNARAIEPEQVTDPGGVNLGELEERFGMHFPCATSTSYGVHTAEHDVQTVYGYFIQHHDGQSDYLPAKYVVHSKLNVDRNVKRGLTDFYPAWKWLMRHDRLMENTAVGAAAQAAIPYIIQYAQGASKQVVNDSLVERTDFSYSVPRSGGGTRTQNVSVRPAGTELHVSEGKEYMPGPMGAERGNAFLDVAAAVLRIVGVRWAMPEYMISGDASNANLASTVESGTPFHNNVETLQHGFGRFQTNALWRVVEHAFRMGLLDRFGLTWAEIKYIIEIMATPPAIQKPDPLPATQRNAILVAGGVMSRPKWAAEEGLDYEQEVADGATVSNDLPLGVTSPGMGATPASGIGAAEPEPIQSETPTAAQATATSSDDTPQNVSASGLNGAQITSAVDVIKSVTARAIAPSVGRELLIALGIADDRASRMIEASTKIAPAAVEGKPAAETLAAESQSTTEAEREAAARKLWADYP